jgi:hypothetical protein
VLGEVKSTSKARQGIELGFDPSPAILTSTLVNIGFFSLPNYPSDKLLPSLSGGLADTVPLVCVFVWGFKQTLFTVHTWVVKVLRFGQDHSHEATGTRHFCLAMNTTRKCLVCRKRSEEDRRRRRDTRHESIKPGVRGALRGAPSNFLSSALSWLPSLHLRRGAATSLLPR